MGIVLITGGSRGLGKNMAQHLAQKGHDIIITYHSKKDEAEKAVAEVTATGRKGAALQLDVSDSKSFGDFAAMVAKTLQEKFGCKDFDALVNNAGTGVHAGFMETTEEQFDQMVNIHFKSTFFLSQKLLPLIKDGGRILNVSSGLARFSMPGYAAYGSMKGGIETLTRYMAKEMAPRKISVNVLAPGAIETDFGGGAVRDNKAVNDMIASSTALGRVGLPDDIGALVSALLSDDCRWVNGQRIEAAGGIFL
ncbi:MAG: fabG 3 [Alphaproteobacteria bacterium]|jgi:NAD(P)-dependent dehydrogenase (short-subunit alcohol dehydrogenase family)|nr:fabG 3 [Alphaproteobacteria bacterium]